MRLICCLSPGPFHSMIIQEYPIPWRLFRCCNFSVRATFLVNAGCSSGSAWRKQRRCLEQSHPKSRKTPSSCIYRGADADFTLYEDETTATTVKREFTRPFRFTGTTIGERNGTFPGILTGRHSRIVLVGEGQGVGITAESKPDNVVTYAGKQMVVRR